MTFNLSSCSTTTKSCAMGLAPDHMSAAAASQTLVAWSGQEPDNLAHCHMFLFPTTKRRALVQGTYRSSRNPPLAFKPKKGHLVFQNTSSKLPNFFQNKQTAYTTLFPSPVISLNNIPEQMLVTCVRNLFSETFITKGFWCQSKPADRPQTKIHGRHPLLELSAAPPSQQSEPQQNRGEHSKKKTVLPKFSKSCKCHKRKTTGVSTDI
jgi:hypothetical protein